MHNENINRAIKLQTTINDQINSKGVADIELVDDLNNLLESFNSHECELLCEWYYKQSKHNEEDEYVQMEIDFLREQEGQLDLAGQWDI
jgi:hypothetical protein